MPRLRRAVGLALLLFVAFTLASCARRSTSAVQLPGAHANASKGEKPSRAGEAARKMREAIRSLKDKIAAGDTSRPAQQSPVGPSSEPPAPTAATGTAGGKQGEVGTAGAWSVETRYPSPPGAAAAQGGAGGAEGRGRLLSRAGRVVRQAGGGSWGGVIALCVIALALVAAALAVRRSRPAA